ncbi:MAG: cysteine synthase family protein [Candidatus Sumerlaeota bacterium]|nr:cysteine synthase family protein [Candidatus Sumerlaeota bacterium]
MSILSAIGNTALVELTRLHQNSKTRIFAKLEGDNPGGSVKDRAALYLIQKAEESGDLTRDKIILEPTSGNTGIAIAMIGAAKGYRVKLVLPACVSIERRRVLEAFGADVVLTPGCERTDGAIREAHRLLAENPGLYYMPNQFANPANPLAHYETTGPEIYRQTDGRVDAFVAGMGTTGTLMGVSRYLKERNPRIRIIGVEPHKGHAIQGLKNMQEAIVPDIYDPTRLDSIIPMDDETAFETARRLAVEEGIFVGMSSGAAVASALRVAQDMSEGIIVTLLPDRGDRYLSTTLFRSVCAECPP